MKGPSTPISPFIEASHINYILSFNTLFNEIKTSLWHNFKPFQLHVLLTSENSKQGSGSVEIFRQWDWALKPARLPCALSWESPLAPFWCHLSYLTGAEASCPARGNQISLLLGGGRVTPRVHGPFWRAYLYYSFNDIWGGSLWAGRMGKDLQPTPKSSQGHTPGH